MQPETVNAADPILSEADPPPVSVINPAGSAGVLLLCDHAARLVPRALSDLGLEHADLDRHIGWDIGAAAVTRLLAERLDATAIMTVYSRLVIDCNRTPGDPTSIPSFSDGILVPGNQELDGAAKAARAASLFQPYHRMIEARLEAFHAAGVTPALISIHSFTPVMNGVARPWQVGVLWDRDPRIPLPLIANFAAIPGVKVGDNEPYSARDPAGFTLRQHAQPRGLPHVLIELRQDEIAQAAGQALWAERIVAALAPILADPQLRRPAFFR
jgi:predicted N-formylglutamate amidohydrolase